MRMLQTHRDRIVGLMLSKTESKADLDKTVAASTGNLPIIALIEFARGILGLGEICGHTSVEACLRVCSDAGLDSDNSPSRSPINADIESIG